MRASQYLSYSGRIPNYAIHHKNRVVRCVDHDRPVISSGERVMRAQHQLASASRPRGLKQQGFCRHEVVWVAVLALAGDPVVAMLLRVAFAGTHNLTIRDGRRGSGSRGACLRAALVDPRGAVPEPPHRVRR